MMSFAQGFLAAILALFLATFLATMVAVRRRGYDPKGVTRGNTAAATVTALATLLWLAVTLLYVFNTRSVARLGRLAFLEAKAVTGVGIGLCLTGLVIGVAGEVTLGASFRVALPRERTRLVTTGIYLTIRNPCVLGVDLVALGTFLIAPSVLALLAAALNFTGYHLKIVAEEAYLRQTHGAAYAAYCARTGRYLPRLRRTGREGAGGPAS